MRYFIAGCLLAGAAWSLGAQEAESEWGFEGPRIIGADFSWTRGSLKVVAGGGWQQVDVGRDWSTGLLRPVNKPKESPFVANGSVSVRQTWSLDEADLWVGAGVLGHGDLGAGAGVPAFVADRNGGVLGFVRAGVTRNRKTVNAHQVPQGTSVELKGEAGPSFLSVRGTDYHRLDLAASWFVPVWDLEGPAQLFSGVAGFRANARWIGGASVPLLLLESTEIRGYHRLFDSQFRSVATGELRIGLPSLVGPADLVPVLFGFAEGGWYRGYSNVAAPVSGTEGWLASAGAGFGMTVLGLTTPTLTVAVPLVDREPELWWTIDFDLRF